MDNNSAHYSWLDFLILKATDSKVCHDFFHHITPFQAREFILSFPTGSKRKSKGQATEQDVFEAGGQKCYQQNLNISFIFTSIMPELSAQNTSLADKIVQFLKSRNSTKVWESIRNKQFYFFFQIICSTSIQITRKSPWLW